MKVRCMLCGRIFEHEVVEPDQFDDEDDIPKKKPLEVCMMCEAKLKREADGKHNVPKPM